MGNINSMEEEYEEGVNLGDIFSDSWLKKYIYFDKTTVKLYEAGIYEPDLEMFMAEGDTLEEAIKNLNLNLDSERTPEDIFTGAQLQAKLVPELEKKIKELKKELKSCQKMLKDSLKSVETA